MRDCETIVSLVTHSSVLRSDDVRFKGVPLGARLCDKCDLAALDDARHLVMQCPDLQRQRGDMMEEIAGLEGGGGGVLQYSILVNICCMYSWEKVYMALPGSK